MQLKTHSEVSFLRAAARTMHPWSTLPILFRSPVDSGGLAFYFFFHFLRRFLHAPTELMRLSLLCLLVVALVATCLGDEVQTKG